MRNLLPLAAILGLVCFSATAQDYPKVEAFGGYQFTHVSPDTNGNGWNASLSANFNRWLGGTADFSGSYKLDEDLYTFLFGPVFSFRKAEKVTPFTHALFGSNYITMTARRSTSSFAMAVGGGVDVKINEDFAVRLVQVDWLPMYVGTKWESKNVRVSAGLVWRF